MQAVVTPTTDPTEDPSGRPTSDRTLEWQKPRISPAPYKTNTEKAQHENPDANPDKNRQAFPPGPKRGAQWAWVSQFCSGSS